MWRRLCISITSAGLLAGCPDHTCGPMGAPEVGLVASSDQVTLTFGSLGALAGHDCTDPSSTVESQTISGTQTDGTGFIVICVPRPDLLVMGMRTLGPLPSTADVQVSDVTGTSNGCTFALDATQPPTGTGSGKGVCANGADPAGFQLTIDGAVSLQRTCTGVIDTVSVTLRGTVAVAHRSQ
jgi:hypothetical protein